jgi:multidrug efflux pump subunit AcrA (membrane-fusion protein)
MSNIVLKTVFPPISRRLFLGASLILGLSACASVSPTYHSMVMRGQVLSVNDNSQTVNPTAQICIGERDGASVGQIFDVIRHVKEGTGRKGNVPYFRPQKVGQVRIVEIYDDHYASVEPVSGGLPQPGDTVEAEGKSP